MDSLTITEREMRQSYREGVEKALEGIDKIRTDTKPYLDKCELLLTPEQIQDIQAEKEEILQYIRQIDINMSQTKADLLETLISLGESIGNGLIVKRSKANKAAR